MAHFKALEMASTKYLSVTAICLVGVAVGVYCAIVYSGLTSVDQLGKFTDAVFKIVALLVGALWALNRYFTERRDAPQIRIDAEVSLIPGWGAEEQGLLIFRLDLVNTGKIQIGPFQHFLCIDVPRPTAEGVELTPLYRWPMEGWHFGGPIEPGSWAALNGEVGCARSIRAVRFFVDVKLDADTGWTWHKTFDVSARADA
ncbi:MAG: hypothetical protein U0002_08405 [Thermoanaerobaculia bacterium]